MVRALVIPLVLATWTVCVGAGMATTTADAHRQAELLDTSRAPSRVQRTLFAAGVHQDRGEMDQARALLRKFLADHPDLDHHLIRHQLGLLLAHADSLVAAREQLEAAVGLAPDFQPAWRNLAEAAYGLGDFTTAATAFTRAVALDPVHLPELRYYEAVAYLLGDRPDRSLALMISLLDDHTAPDLAWHRVLLAAALGADRAADITTHMTILTDDRPDDPEAWLLASRQAQAMADYDRAVGALTVTGYLRPLHRDELFLLGDLCAAADTPTRAARHYETALAMDGSATGAELDRLVAAYLAAFATDRALVTLDRRLALEPTAEAWRLKGEVLYGQDLFAAALTAFDAAADMAPHDARLDLLRGYCCLELEQPDRAAGYLRAAMRDERWAAPAGAALEHLQRLDRLRQRGG
ncbi:hypothetical protein DRQ50_02110 [bacterium]|nr:MAG: hypothetical protein DRQ50_02110 [bacterium]